LRGQLKRKIEEPGKVRKVKSEEKLEKFEGKKEFKKDFKKFRKRISKRSKTVSRKRFFASQFNDPRELVIVQNCAILFFPCETPY
jgi:hypothetical protein